VVILLDPAWVKIKFYGRWGWGMKTPYLHNVGRRFSRLVAVEYVGVRSTGSMWRFRCDCGSAHEATIVGRYSQARPYPLVRVSEQGGVSEFCRPAAVDLQNVGIDAPAL
jgi:hypothetical protein